MATFNNKDVILMALKGDKGDKGDPTVSTSSTILALTEDKGIYIATDTGHWYYWNGSQYVDGGVYQATGIANGSVTTEKTDFFNTDKNEIVVFYTQYTPSITGNTALYEANTRAAFFNLSGDTSETIKISVLEKGNRFRVYAFDEYYGPYLDWSRDTIERSADLFTSNDNASEFEFKNTNGYKTIMVYLNSSSETVGTIKAQIAYSELDSKLDVTSSFEHMYLGKNQAPIPTYLVASFGNGQLSKILHWTVYFESNCRVAMFYLEGNEYEEVTITTDGINNKFKIGGMYDYYYDWERPTGSGSNQIDEMIVDNDELKTYTFINTKKLKTIFVYLSSNGSLPTITVNVNKNKKIENCVIEANVIKKFNEFYGWKCPTQNAIDDLETWQSDKYINDLYETLRTANPEYISRTNIGKDASNTYDMWEYVFEPPCYEQVVYVQSGDHSREKDAVIGLANFLKIICEDWQSSEVLNYLRWKVKFVVIPIMNPWGISKSYPSDDNNSNGVNLNRDGYSQAQQETKNMMARIKPIADQLSFAIDFHTTVNNTYGDYGMVYASENQPNIDVLKETVAFLCQLNVEGEPDLHYWGVQESQNKYVDYWYHILNINNVALPEHADYVWSGARHTSIALTRSTELIGNTIINLSMQKYKVIQNINKYFQ